MDMSRTRAKNAGAALPHGCTQRRQERSQITAHTSASTMLALCDMRTLYLRNVPDEVGERLEALAAREGMSLSAFASRELAAVARRADNPVLLGSLPSIAVDPASIVADLDAGRGER
jgi:hypothetical protein